MMLAFFFASCGKEPAPNVVSSATRNTRATLGPMLAQIMPEAMEDGMVKVAIVRNLAMGDYARQYMESCVAEGRAIGFVVDSFILGGDDEQSLELIARIAAADYDGLILSLGGANFSYNSLLPAVDKKIKIVTFDALPYKDDDSRKDFLSGITVTAQDDEGLAETSLNGLIDYFSLDADDNSPPRLISIIAEPGIPPLDIRRMVYDRFIREGRIIEKVRISPGDLAYARSGIREELINVLAKFPPGTVDAIWAPFDEFARGCFDALDETGRRDIKLVSIDISNDDIKLMLEHSNQWIASSVTDPSVAGLVNMRLLAGMLAGDSIPDTYLFKAHLIETSMLNHSINMANISLHIPGWPSAEGLFEYPWISVLKNCVIGSSR